MYTCRGFFIDPPHPYHPVLRRVLSAAHDERAMAQSVVARAATRSGNLQMPPFSRDGQWGLRKTAWLTRADDGMQPSATLLATGRTNGGQGRRDISERKAKDPAGTGRKLEGAGRGQGLSAPPSRIVGRVWLRSRRRTTRSLLGFVISSVLNCFPLELAPTASSSSLRWPPCTIGLPVPAIGLALPPRSRR